MKFFFRALLLSVSCLISPALSVLAQDGKLTGTVIGTESSYDYETGAVSTTVNSIANAFDGDLSTFVATYDRSHTWVGLDLGTPHVITGVGWSPRDSEEGPQRVLLGLFEGSNREDFMDAIPLYMITEKGTIGEISHADVNVSRGFRYVRWCGPADSRSNVAEIEFYGHEGEGDDSQFYQLTNLPTLSYHTYCGLEPYDKTTELESEMCIIYDGGTHIQEYPVLARERGNGSRDGAFLKRPYRIKFNDGKSHHMLKDSPLESPAKAKKWTLIPNWRDKSLLRNNIAFEMSRRLGLAYTPWIQNVDVIVNGEFKGNYQLCDQITVDPNRVGITEMMPEDIEEPFISGGYLVEITNPGGTSSRFSSNRGIPVDIKSPDSDEIATEQFNYVRQAFNDMESSLFSAAYKDPEQGYRTHLDVESFLRHFLVGEFAGNTDSYWSVWMYKEREDSLFRTGPVWDFDLCMNNDRRVYPANGKSKWLFNYGSVVSGMKDFVNRVLSDPYADATLCSIWAEMRRTKAFSSKSLFAYVDSLAQVIDESQKLNFTRWDNLGQLLTLQQFAPGTYEGEINIIKDYLEERILWIDNMLGYEEIEEVDPSDTLYVIKSPQQLIAFQNAVNNQGMTKLDGLISSDLDLSTVSARLQPIGTPERPYEGVFDGQNRIIYNLSMDREEDNVGLFGVVKAGAVIRGITLDSSCSIHGANGVGLVGSVQGEGIVTLECLGNEGKVTATDKWAGGILGTCSDASTQVYVNYCYASGSVSGQQESAAISGWLGQNPQVTGCYNIASIEGFTSGYSFARHEGGTFTRCFNNNRDVQSGVKKLSDTNVTRGDLCYRLHDHSSEDAPVYFYQTLGEDDHPVLQHHLEVIREGTTYTNKTTFDISNAQEMVDFANMVNGGFATANALVTADLDFQDITLPAIGSSELPYVGCFDGQGHTFSNLVINSNQDYAGIFSIIGPGARIQNFVLDETCSIKGASYTAIVGGALEEGDVYLVGIGNEGTVQGTKNAGAIFGCAMNNRTSINIDNCYSSGAILADNESGALTGYIGKGHIYNSWSSATIEGYYKRDHKPFALCYCDTKNNYIVHTDLNSKFDIKSVTAEQVRNGELCYKLNQNSGLDTPIWYQTLGVDEHPVFDVAHGEVKLSDTGEYYNEGVHIHSLPADEDYVSYSPTGVRMSKSQRGLHIIRTSSGKTYKILVR